jgi:hypothetical protein
MLLSCKTGMTQFLHAEMATTMALGPAAADVCATAAQARKFADSAVEPVMWMGKAGVRDFVKLCFWLLRRPHQ